MHCGRTNNDPGVIVQRYCDAVHAVQGIVYNKLRCSVYLGVPMVLRADRGTENSIVAFVQPSLRS